MTVLTSCLHHEDDDEDGRDKAVRLLVAVTAMRTLPQAFWPKMHPQHSGELPMLLRYIAQQLSPDSVWTFTLAGIESIQSILDHSESTNVDLQTLLLVANSVVDVLNASRYESVKLETLKLLKRLVRLTREQVTDVIPSAKFQLFLSREQSAHVLAEAAPLLDQMMSSPTPTGGLPTSRSV